MKLLKLMLSLKIFQEMPQIPFGFQSRGYSMSAFSVSPITTTEGHGNTLVSGCSTLIVSLREELEALAKIPMFNWLQNVSGGGGGGGGGGGFCSNSGQL